MPGASACKDLSERLPIPFYYSSSVHEYISIKQTVDLCTEIDSSR